MRFCGLYWALRFWKWKLWRHFSGRWNATNQVKTPATLSRSYAFGEQSAPEKGAQVRVVDQDGNALPYREKEDFIYEATQAFGAVAGKYHVEITTASGENYRSRPMITPAKPM